MPSILEHIGKQCGEALALVVRAQLPRRHDRAQVGQRRGEVVVDHDVVELDRMRDVLARVGEAAADRRVRILRARAQAALELDARRRQDEDADGIGQLRAQSISSSTSLPEPSVRSTAVRAVPLRSPCTIACSKNSPRLIISSNTPRETKW